MYLILIHHQQNCGTHTQNQEETQVLYYHSHALSIIRSSLPLNLQATEPPLELVGTFTMDAAAATRLCPQCRRCYLASSFSCYIDMFSIWFRLTHEMILNRPALDQAVVALECQLIHLEILVEELQRVQLLKLPVHRQRHVATRTLLNCLKMIPANKSQQIFNPGTSMKNCQL